MGNKKPPLAHRITSNRSGAVGFLCFLEVLSITREFDPLQLQNRPISGRFASFSRYFKIMLPEISSLNSSVLFSLISAKKMKNTTFSCGVFSLHLFLRHKLVRLTGVEPVRPSGHKHLKLASLPIPAQPQSAAFFRPLGYYTVIVMICQRFFQLFTGWLKQEHNWVKRQSKKQSLRKPESGGTFFISRRFSPKKWTGLDYTGRNWKGEEQHGRLVQPAGGAGNEGA